LARRVIRSMLRLTDDGSCGYEMLTTCLIFVENFFKYCFCGVGHQIEERGCVTTGEKPRAPPVTQLCLPDLTQHRLVDLVSRRVRAVAL